MRVTKKIKNNKDFLPKKIPVYVQKLNNSNMDWKTYNSIIFEQIAVKQKEIIDFRIIY